VTHKMSPDRTTSGRVGSHEPVTRECANGPIWACCDHCRDVPVWSTPYWATTTCNPPPLHQYSDATSTKTPWQTGYVFRVSITLNDCFYPKSYLQHTNTTSVTPSSSIFCTGAPVARGNCSLVWPRSWVRTSNPVVCRWRARLPEKLPNWVRVSFSFFVSWQRYLLPCATKGFFFSFPKPMFFLVVNFVI
jgi:hypothetical protein